MQQAPDDRIPQKQTENEGDHKDIHGAQDARATRVYVETIVDHEDVNGEPVSQRSSPVNGNCFSL